MPRVRKAAGQQLASGAKSEERAAVTGGPVGEGSMKAGKKGSAEATTTTKKQPQATPQVSGRGKSAGKASAGTASTGAKGRGKGKAAAGKLSGAGVVQWPMYKEPTMLTVEEFERRILGRRVSVSATTTRPTVGPLAKMPIDAVGVHCTVHKHSGMGCAVVSMSSALAREILMAYIEHHCPAGAPIGMEINGVSVTVKRHKDRETDREVITDVFIAWGHKVEKETPLPAEDIAEAFDKVYEQAEMIRKMMMAYMFTPAWHTGLYTQIPASAPVAAMSAAVGSPTTPTTQPMAASSSTAAARGFWAQPPRSPLDNGFAPLFAHKPHVLPIINPETGQKLDTLEIAGFEPRKPPAPLTIMNPATGEIVL